jgi:predicted nucleotidyltransferase component of viral defense system
MIPRAAITEWAGRVAWPIEDQVEQDLLLSRLIVEIANDAYLGEELVFRGGTCLHNLHAQRPLRYREDLDYVRRTGGGIAEVTRAATRLGEMLGMEVRTKISEHPKIYLRAPFESGSARMRIKIEINTFERSPAHEPVRLPYAVDSMWFAGSADVATFTLAELVATKLRALYQRLKGRDLFDLWLAITELGVDPAEIVDAFAPYRPAVYTAGLAERNLREKLPRAAFRNDLDALLTARPAGYDIHEAAELVITELFARLPP